MKLMLLALLLLSSCIEYRLSKPGISDKYIGWSNTKPQLDPKIGPKVKIFTTQCGDIRPYIGCDIIHQEELLLGIGVVYYLDGKDSLEIGIRDSVYKNTDILHEYKEEDRRTYDSWLDENPMIFLGGVVRF